MIKAEIAEEIRSIYLNKKGSPHDPTRNIKYDLTLKIMDIASIGVNEFYFKTEEPLPESVLIYFRNLGYSVELEGFKYKISW